MEPGAEDLLDDARAALRGERRAAPYGARGRIFEKTGQGPLERGHTLLKVNAVPTLDSLEISVRRQDGSVEEYVVKDGVRQLVRVSYPSPALKAPSLWERVRNLFRS